MQKHFNDYDLTAVVAMDLNRGIGKDNALVWHLPEDLAHFKKVTLNKPIIMGRKTFESIGRPLPKRENIVLTRDTQFSSPGIQIVHSIEQALGKVGGQPASVIGGADIFRMMMPYLRQLVITEIKSTFDCDVFFPEIDLAEWKKIDRTPEMVSEQSQLRYVITTYQRTDLT